MNPDLENIALFDMDNTLCDYHGALTDDLTKLASPSEPPVKYQERYPDHIRNRQKLITRQPGWWKNLKKLKLGFDIFDMAGELGFERCVLTKGPANNPRAWAEKVEWCDDNLPSGTTKIIAEDKGLIYGKVLVDDWPAYVTRWLKWRPRGLVILPANEWNADYSHENAIRYDGSKTSQLEVFKALKNALERTL